MKQRTSRCVVLLVLLAVVARALDIKANDDVEDEYGLDLKEYVKETQVD